MGDSTHNVKRVVGRIWQIIHIVTLPGSVVSTKDVLGTIVGMIAASSAAIWASMANLPGPVVAVLALVAFVGVVWATNGVIWFLGNFIGKPETLLKIGDVYESHPNIYHDLIDPFVAIQNGTMFEIEVANGGKKKIGGARIRLVGIDKPIDTLTLPLPLQEVHDNVHSPAKVFEFVAEDYRRFGLVLSDRPGEGNGIWILHTERGNGVRSRLSFGEYRLTVSAIGDGAGKHEKTFVVSRPNRQSPLTVTPEE
ncbi:MAG: hypothetical protein ABIK65_10585 [Candidatus Eisenbacteria bacterium]